MTGGKASLRLRRRGRDAKGSEVQSAADAGGSQKAKANGDRRIENL